MISGTLTRPRALAAVAVALLALVLAGRFLARAGTPDAAPSAGGPTGPVVAPAADVVVDVVGSVRRPGLYHLRQGARIADAIAKAGGATRQADEQLVNLAAPLADGQQILVPKRAPSGGTASADPAAAAGPVHLATATLEQLDALPGVGPVTAQKILDYRRERGAFTSVDELDAIPGIGPARLDQLRKVVAP
jgi:competence protein ComEA